MKIVLARIVAVTILLPLLLSGCGRAPDTGPAAKGGGYMIATSFYPMYIIALNVAKDTPGVTVVNMAPVATGCLHDYSATPGDMKKLESADCLIVNGAGMESFLARVAEQYPKLRVIVASDGIPLIEGGGDTDGNPHVWVGISNYIRQVGNVEARLSDLDAAHATQYRANASAYLKKLEALRDRMHKALDGVKNRDIVTFHEAFPYFAQEFNLRIAGVIEREPGSEPSAKELADTIELIGGLKVKALFAEPQYPGTAAETIARETGVKVFILDPATTGPDDPDAYLNIMQNNLTVLSEALK